MTIATVSEKGLVVIPKEIRDKYGIKKGSKVSFIDYGGTIYLFPERPEGERDFGFGMLADGRPGPSATEELLAERRREREREEEKIAYWEARGRKAD